ncbi:O-Antigen ligase [Oceanobacillus limi]|uniref:O-Antigen ligase n=1 Tax=Oceanobacillus limi TaxID=930131 RepID=A0A1I0A344_9BACI|nr:O-antigen ligase family protein [Oceanobacillus limi]SES88563.1 O-Antigen ligase [Oceanobacillus limi]
MNKFSQNQLSFLLSGAFFLILLFNVFTVTKLPISDLAFTTMEWMHYVAFFVVGYTMAKQVQGGNKITPFYSGITLFGLGYVLVHLINGNYYNNSELTVILLYLVFILAVSHVKWKPKHFILFGYMSLGVILLLMIQWVQLGAQMSSFQSYIRNPNILGVFVSCLLFFPLVAIKYVPTWNRVLFIFGIGAACILIYVSSARAVLLLLVTVFLSRLILFYSKKVFYYLLGLLLLFNTFFLLVYTMLANSAYFKKLNELSVDIFGKNLFSGRQDVWESVLQFGLKQPFFGHEVGIVPKDYIEGTHYVHTHNQYLQIFIESGIVGMVLFVLFLYGIWKVYQKGLDFSIVRWSACFFLGILVYQNVEVSLFFNMQSIGLLQWFIISVGISGVLYSKTMENDTRYNS